MHGWLILPNADRLSECLDLNRAGRRILSSASSVPDALLPFVLARTNIILDEDGSMLYFFFLQNYPRIPVLLLFLRCCQPCRSVPKRVLGRSLIFLVAQHPFAVACS
jgi:hypothetical protein